MAHPYRQKAHGSELGSETSLPSAYAPASAPYPVHETIQKSAGTNSSSASVASYKTTPLAEDASLSAARGPQMPLMSPKFSGRSQPDQHSVPYPMEDSFPQNTVPNRYSAVVSPPLNPMSATSSVTNLNLNNTSHPHTPSQTPTPQQTPAHTNAASIYSKSDNNLPVQGSISASLSKYGHNRSVSSVSSFFYDRNDNSSIADFSQNVIQLYLGSNLSHLMPRFKTIEMYRQNARKSDDPAVLFQYAQYMLQTALLLDTSSPVGSGGPNTPQKSVVGSQSSIDLSEKKHRKSKSFASFDVLNASPTDLKKSLLKEAHRYLKRLSDKGYVDAQYLLGDAYSSGAFGKIDNREAFYLFLNAAKHGHVESSFRVAHCYEDGLGTGRDARKGIEFLKMAATKNHAAAMYKLGVYSYYGRMGLPLNVNVKKSGIKWLERASNVATELTAAAPYELGKIYYDGFLDIVLQDKKYALELFAQAAALGHVESAAILGQHYEVGDTVPEDPNLSIHYYTKAALGGHSQSMLAMCAWYLVGLEPFLPKDDQEAFEWAKRAAMCGLPKAQFALANFYDKEKSSTKTRILSTTGVMESRVTKSNSFRRIRSSGTNRPMPLAYNFEIAPKLSTFSRKTAGVFGSCPSSNSKKASVIESTTFVSKCCVGS